MARSNSRRIDSLSLVESFIRGITSEEIVEEALQYLEQAGLILGYSRSDDSHDWLGIDFTVYLEDDGAMVNMPLQVKSSERGLRKHAKEYHDIPGVAVDDSDIVGDVADKILIALNLDHPLVEKLSQELFRSLTYQYL